HRVWSHTQQTLRKPSNHRAMETPKMTPKTSSQRIAESCADVNIIVIIMNLWNCRFSIKTATSLCFCGKENDMVIDSVSHSLLMLIAGGTASLILAAGSACAAPRAQADLVEFEKMTWVEVQAAVA